MTDVLIRDVPEDDLRLLDQRAERLGVSRAVLLRDLLLSEARSESAHLRLDLSVADFAIFNGLPDAADEDFIRNAWSHNA